MADGGNCRGDAFAGLVLRLWLVRVWRPATGVPGSVGGSLGVWRPVTGLPGSVGGWWRLGACWLGWGRRRAGARRSQGIGAPRGLSWLIGWRWPDSMPSGIRRQEHAARNMPSGTRPQEYAARNGGTARLEAHATSLPTPRHCPRHVITRATSLPMPACGALAQARPRDTDFLFAEHRTGRPMPGVNRRQLANTFRRK